MSLSIVKSRQAEPRALRNVSQRVFFINADGKRRLRLAQGVRGCRDICAPYTHRVAEALFLEGGDFPM
jgi:hypothetical protein